MATASASHNGCSDNGGGMMSGLLMQSRSRVPVRVLPLSAIAKTKASRTLRSAETAPSPESGAPFDLLYLFFCSLLWQKGGDTTAGWELTHGLRSGDPRARSVAANLMAKTEDVHLPARNLRKVAGLGNRIAPDPESPPPTPPVNEVRPMKTPYGLEIIESCLTCKLRRPHWFCGFSHDALSAFSAATHPTTYPGGALLFVEGQVPRGAYVLCSGKVKLSTTSRDGKVLILKVAEAGEVLGLSAVITGEYFEVTAETVGPCNVNFIDREGLLRLMERHGDIGLRSAQLLSKEFQSMYRDVHDLVLTRSSAGKLARLLLSWSPGLERANGNEVRIRSSVTHEEMAQMIGASRETVTRLLSELKKKELIRLEGSTLVIRNRPALEALAA